MLKGRNQRSIGITVILEFHTEVLISFTPKSVNVCSISDKWEVVPHGTEKGKNNTTLFFTRKVRF